MRLAEENAATLTLEIPNRDLARTLMAQWSRQPGISLSIRRGRVTADEARLELEVRGSAARVAGIVRQSARWGVPA